MKKEGHKPFTKEEANELMATKKSTIQEKDLTSNIPDGENDWVIGSETFTRKEVFKLLWTQRAMISNDIKSLRFNTSFPELKLYNSGDIYEILKNPRIPEI